MHTSQPVRYLVTLLFVLALLAPMSAAPSPAYAQTTADRANVIIEKRYCTYALDYATIDVIKDELASKAKQLAVTEFFGEYIDSTTTVEDAIVSSDRVQASSAGFVRIDGNAEYYNGPSFAEVCVLIHAYVTEDDLAMFEPQLVQKRVCVTNDDLTALQITALAKNKAQTQALYEYDRSLEKSDINKALELLKQVTFTEAGFLPDSTTYCATVEGYVTPIEVLTYKSDTGMPVATATVVAPTLEPVVTDTPTTTPMPTSTATSAPQPSPSPTTAPPTAIPTLVVPPTNTAVPAPTQEPTREPTPTQQAGAGLPLGDVISLDPIVVSEHPYANDIDSRTFIGNSSSQNAMQLHFNRIEIEEGVDRIEILDAREKLVQEITQSHPNGLWTDVIPGAGAYVRLVTDGADVRWGFEVDFVSYSDYATEGYSAHPYFDDTDDALVVLNNEAGAIGTAVRFSRVELESGVDYIIIMDQNDLPYQWITGSHPDGLASLAVPGIAAKVRLVTDGSVRNWGYNVAGVVSGQPGAPEDGPDRSALAVDVESSHPYESTNEEIWTITNPNSAALSTKVHFDELKLHDWGSVLLILDSQDTIVQTFNSDSNGSDFWSDPVPGRVLKMMLMPDGDSQWGFRIDALTDSVPTPGLIQSDHPYRNRSAVWTITNPDPDAKSSKVHFSHLYLHPWGSALQILDSDDTVIQTYTADDNGDDLWSDYVPGRVIRVKLYPDGDSAWGYRIDRLANSVDTPGLVQSDHPYGQDDEQIWIVSNPDPDAKSSKVHFSHLYLHPWGSALQILDSDDTVIQTYTADDNGDDLWSDYVPGRIVKIQLMPDGDSAWGFRVDAIESR